MMKCPNCDKEMKKGQATFISMEGFGTMMVSFVSDDDSKKSFIKRQSKGKLILSGTTAEAFCCLDCNKMVSVFDME